jgi:hypothetical protein
VSLPGESSEDKIHIVAAVQTTSSGQPVPACLRQQTHSHEAVSVFAAQHITTAASGISDGLWCFLGAQIVGAEHESVVTGGSKASLKPPRFEAVNTLLGNFETGIGGTFHAVLIVASVSPEWRLQDAEFAR